MKRYIVKQRNHSFQRTYEELKPEGQDAIDWSTTCFQRTYEELKRESARQDLVIGARVFSVPMRN